jgi:DNA mismatch repair protein MutL
MPIRVLPDRVAATIAAGEVVERPASVVKELVENALDAGSTRIDIVVRGAKLSCISVTDNGPGMDQADLPLSLARHATSKLPDDRLDRISTLGFRGEALPSIATVASVRLTSRTKGQDVAFSVSQSFGGEVSKPRPSAGGLGTRVDVEGLFDRHPARLKFLKSDATERAWVRYVVDREALANPGVRFSLDLQGSRGAIIYSPETASRRAGRVCGEPLAGNGIEVLLEKNGVSVAGLTTMPSALEKSASGADFFVNGRHVSSRGLSAAVQQPYRELVGAEGYPHCVLMISVDPSEVDVNVHPRKAEVRFRDEAAICSVVTEAISAALASAGLRSPKALAGLAKSLAVRHDAELGDRRRLPLGRYMGQANSAYIVAETIDGLVIIDQHAAHERVVMERLKAASVDLEETVVRLPSPVVRQCDVFETAAVADAREVLYGLGFKTEVSPRGVELQAYPSVLTGCGPAELLEMLVDCCVRGSTSGLLGEAMWETIATAACKAAIKAGHELTPDRADALLREMEATPNISHCNHGRPTVAFLNSMDLGRLFERS